MRWENSPEQVLALSACALSCSPAKRSAKTQIRFAYSTRTKTDTYCDLEMELQIFSI